MSHNSPEHSISQIALDIIFVIILAIYFLVGLKFNFVISFAILSLFIVFLWFGTQFAKFPSIAVAVMVIGTSLDVLGRIMGMPVTIFHIGVLLTIFIFILRVFFYNDFAIHTTNFDLPLLFFLCLIAVSLLYTPAKEEGLVDFLRVLALVLVMYLTINIITKSKGIYIIVFTFIASAFVLSLFAAKSIAITPESLVQASLGFSKVFGRFGVTFENPNYFATYLMFTMLLGFSVFLNGHIRTIYRIILLAVLITIIFALIGTFSRAAWVAAIPSLLIVINYSKYRRFIFVGGVIASLALFGLLLQNLFFKSFVMRFSSLTQAKADPSSMTRVFLMIGGLKMLLNSLLIGVGFRGFPSTYESLYKPPNQILSGVVESHTLPVEILAELGIIGFLLFSFIIFRYFKYGFNSIHKIKNPLLRACQIGFVAGMVGFLTNSLFSPGSLEANLLWLGFGMTYAIGIVDKSEITQLSQ